MACSEKKRRMGHVELPSANATGYVEGSVIQITMKDFLTYSHVVVNPGPNLNMIVGANGTGKSSIVCALCLGLAGKPSVLGRGEKVGVFVRLGCSKGSLEIVIYRRKGNLKIHREIYAESNQSIWMLNGRTTSQRAVEEEVKALQIQVGNLCQFLPQEKVGEFAKMSNIELLEATEKSVGPPEMYAFHCELKTFRSKERELENSVKEKASFLEKAKQRNERNKHDVQRYYEKKKHLDVIQMLEKKKLWVEYEATRSEMEEVKKEREDVKKELRRMKELQAPMVRKMQSIDNQLKPIENQIREKTSSIREATNKYKRKQDQLDRKAKEIEDIRQTLSLNQTEEADREKRISVQQRSIESMKEELDKLSDQPDPTPQIEAVNRELRQVQEEKAKLEMEKTDLSREKNQLRGEHAMLTNRLRSMEDMLKMKEDKLRQRSADTLEAIKWLRQNKHLFKGRVHEPMMLVINVKDSRYAKYVENHISFNDLRAFVFQRKDDMEKFMREVRDNKNWKVNSISAPAESACGRPPSRPIEALKKYGFFSYLRELFTAPEDVLSFLINHYKVHEVPVGTAQTKQMIKEVIKEPNMKVLFTAEERYQVKKSSYSGCLSTSNSSLRPSQFLTVPVDADAKGQLEEGIRTCQSKMQAIDVQMRAIQERGAELDRKDNELRAQKKELSDRKQKKRQLEQRMISKQESLREMQRGGIDLVKAERETRTKIAAVNAQKVAIIAEIVAHMKEKKKLTMELVHLSLKTVGLTAEKAKLENDYRQDTGTLKTLEHTIGQLDQRRVRLLDECKSRLKRAREVCNMDHKQEKLSEDLHVAFGQLPATVDEIDARLNEERSRAECFTGLHENVVEEYNRREQEIRNLEQELADQTTTLDTYRQNITEAKERWLNPLKQLVEQINVKFSDFFRSMHCAGEVDLHSDNEEEYDKYGIRIRVKFRSDTQLHELTAHHQSGGERSVSTMLYLMALQDLNRCPFRVVDEINQGMDPVNERRVFDIVVRTACKGTTSQYFFITPKLLQKLSYGKEMTVLAVYNGDHLATPVDCVHETFIKRKQIQKQRREPSC